MIREELIVECMEGRGDWNDLTWDELEFLQDKITSYISSISTDKLIGILASHKTLQ